MVNDFAICIAGQIVYLDESPPLLKGILLNGGHLVFDDNQDIKLMMEYMIILGDGSLKVHILFFSFFTSSSYFMKVVLCFGIAFNFYCEIKTWQLQNMKISTKHC